MIKSLSTIELAARGENPAAIPPLINNAGKDISAPITPVKARLALILIIAAGLPMAVILYWFNPTEHSFYPLCPLYWLTGIYCPGCGALRAVHHLTHGRVLTALQCNAFVTGGLLFGFGHFAHRLAARLRGIPLPAVRIRPPALFWLGMGLLAFTVLRNIHPAPFNLLAPP